MNFCSLEKVCLGLSLGGIGKFPELKIFGRIVLAAEIYCPFSPRSRDHKALTPVMGDRELLTNKRKLDLLSNPFECKLLKTVMLTSQYFHTNSEKVNGSIMIIDVRNG